MLEQRLEHVLPATGARGLLWEPRPVRLRSAHGDAQGHLDVFQAAPPFDIQQYKMLDVK